MTVSVFFSKVAHRPPSSNECEGIFVIKIALSRRSTSEKSHIWQGVAEYMSSNGSENHDEKATLPIAEEKKF
ncbi:MAG: hypothetical protein KME43_14195 [Myxacorys chilensis ATA2-1-KO14]|jgi:hypothetical protein|nr:hypothetical protein [Myxacorys chilensis ATA2-1-KO14]